MGTSNSNKFKTSLLEWEEPDFKLAISIETYIIQEEKKDFFKKLVKIINKKK